MKAFVNGTKIPVIPPLLENNKLTIDFNINANVFNDFLNQQCTTVGNTSEKTEKKLSTFEICNNDIVKFIRSLDLSKAHDHDEI